MPPHHRRRPSGIRTPRVAGRVPAGRSVDARPAEPSADARTASADARVAEPETAPETARPAQRRSRPRGVASVLPARAPASAGTDPDTGSPAVALGTQPIDEVPDDEVPDDTAAADTAVETPVAAPDEASAENSAGKPTRRGRRSIGLGTPGPADGPVADEPVVEETDVEETAADDDGGVPRRSRLRALRLPVATTPRATAAVAAVAALLLAAAVFMGVSWWRTAHSAAVENTALVDVATTAQVSQQLGDAVKKVYSFDYTRLDQNEQAARGVITPEFQADYDRLFGQVRTLGTQQQAVVTATISQIAVREVHGDTAVAVVFVDQQATKAAASDGQTQAASSGRLTVTGKLVDGQWKIAGVQVL